MRSSWLPAPIGSTRGKRLAEEDRQSLPAPEDEPEAQERGPLRRCIATRVVKPKAELLRFVVGPDGSLVFDASTSLPGRGLWLSADRDVIEGASRRGVFGKAARRRVSVPDLLADRVSASIEARIVDLLGFARRSGAALAGFEKVREMLAARGCVALVEASDGSVAERLRLLNGRELPVFTPLTATRLGGVFGRDAATHVGLGPGRLASMIAVEAARLAGVKGEPAPPVIAIAGESGQRDAARRPRRMSLRRESPAKGLS